MNQIMNDDEKLKDFLSNIDKLRVKNKMAKLPSSLKDDPNKYIVRNQELALVWDQYEHDRKQLLSRYNQEKLHRAR